MALAINIQHIVMVLLYSLAVFTCELQPIFAEEKAAEKSEVKDYDWESEVKKILKKYNSNSGIKMDVKKKVHLELLDEEKESNGTLLFKKGQINLEIKKPEFSKIVMNEKTIWVVQKNSKDKTLVTVINNPSITSKTKAPIAFLMSDIKVWENFKLVGKKVEGKKLQLAFEPKESANMPDVVYLKLNLDKSNLKIKGISITDELENKTVYSFSNIEFSQKISKKKFNYSIPKGADVTHF